MDIVSTTDLIAQVRSLHNEVLAAQKSALEKARECGVKLKQLKAEQGHGSWLTFIYRQLAPLSPRTVRLYMQIAENWEEIKDKVGGEETINAAMRVLQPKKPATATARRKPIAKVSKSTVQIKLVEAKIKIGLSKITEFLKSLGVEVED